MDRSAEPSHPQHPVGQLGHTAGGQVDGLLGAGVDALDALAAPVVEHQVDIAVGAVDGVVGTGDLTGGAAGTGSGVDVDLTEGGADIGGTLGGLVGLHIRNGDGVAPAQRQSGIGG